MTVRDLPPTPASPRQKTLTIRTTGCRRGCAQPTYPQGNIDKAGAPEIVRTEPADRIEALRAILSSVANLPFAHGVHGIVANAYVLFRDRYNYAAFGGSAVRTGTIGAERDFSSRPSGRRLRMSKTSGTHTMLMSAMTSVASAYDKMAA